MILKRILALAALAVLLFLLLLLLYLAFSGAEAGYIMAVLFMLMIVPALFYVMKWLADVLRK